ncbi:MAG: hypothetical protein SF339_11845 [Blastocatellia bacterium]|nr:hypothetical protein [Blastocatellia bacterium]
MLDANTEEMIETGAVAIAGDVLAPETDKAPAAKSKPKAAKPKPAPTPAVSTGPLYLLLAANGKYRELQEADLVTEAAGVLRDPSLRLVKAQSLTPQISFKLTDE